jgi:hypothetical protein
MARCEVCGGPLAHGKCAWCLKHPILDYIAKKRARESAWAGAEDGAARAADHAERVEPGWKDEALVYFRAFAVAKRHTSFLTEEARVFAEGDGFALPPDKRAWGSVALRAKRAGIVERVGYASTSLGPSHACPRNEWRLADG